MVLGTRRVNRLWYIVLVGALLFLEFVLSETYVDKFAVHIPGGKRIVEEIAQKHGCINLGQIGMLEDHYLFHHPHVSKRSSEKSHHHLRLSEDSQVVWVEQQTLLSRKKRDFLPAPAGVINEENDIAERRRRAPTGRSDGSKTYTKEMNFNDDLYNKMWYFHGGGFNHTDMNVMGAWKKGVTGKDVVISILDDGIEKNHDDLKDNYDPYASYDVNSHDADPMPRYDYTNENRHGTRCAGEVSAKANNTKCIVGIAYDSRIGGVRMLDGDVYDAVEATSLSFNRSHIDIYSASWGPDDDGRVVDGPGPLAKKAFIDGIRMGRKGLGSIFVWASGNGGNQHDSCNCDGYANSIYTLSISSISQQGLKPWYLEECASTLATTYSSGKYSEKQVITVDLHNRCTDTHTGTSASAPLAAGIVALILEVKPDLTWRDVQYITLMTSRYMPDGDWVTNGVGRRVSLRYGYGLMDATAMVELAEKWTNVPEQHICEVFSSVQKIDIPDDGYEEMLDTNACAETPRAVKYLEHVQAKLTIKSKRRGNLIIHLTSPMGTRSTILPQRPSDSDRMKGFDSWPFLSVHFWGENPVGRWKLEIEVKQNSNSYVGGRYTGSSQTTNDLISWSLVLHGTEENPVNLNTVTVPMPIPTGTAGPCYSECVDTCSGPSATQCDQCKNFRMPDSGACVSACPAGYYGKLGICRPCEPSCAMCTKVSSSEVMCLQCKEGFLLVEGKGVCRQFCEKGYYEDKMNGHCRLCSGKCGTCSVKEDNCTSCRLGLLLKGSQCVPEPKSCPIDQYLAPSGRCEKCPTDCLTCSSRQNCTCCNRGSYLKEGNCVNRCGNGYLPFHVNYSTSMVFQQCQECKNDCDVCPQGFSYVKGVCVQKSNCPEGTYFQWAAMTCKPCNMSCKACIGPSTSDCLTCYPPFGYSMYKRKCIKCCTAQENSRDCCKCIEEGKCHEDQGEEEKMKKKLFSVATIIIVLLIICISVIGVFLILALVMHMRKRTLLHDDVQYSKLLDNEYVDDKDEV